MRRRSRISPYDRENGEFPTHLYPFRRMEGGHPAGGFLRVPTMAWLLDRYRQPTPPIMNTHVFQFPTTAAILLASALIGTGCGSTTEEHTAEGNTYHSDTVLRSPTIANADTDHLVMDTIRIAGAAPGTPVYDERYAASKEVRGYRALLMTELATIRARLNDGTRPPDEAEKDKARAAELAQGLERMDRLIIAVEESDDVAWTSIRESRLKEAQDVREWAAAHGYKLRS